MRFHSIASAVLIAVAVSRAEVVDDVSSAASDASASSTGISKPTFTVRLHFRHVSNTPLTLTFHQPTNLKAPFLEQFTDDWDSRWKASHAKKQADKSSEEEWQYVGTWSVEEPVVLKGMEGDKGLVVKDKAAHHAISAKFAKPIDPKGKDLVVQYEVKLQGKLYSRRH